MKRIDADSTDSVFDFLEVLSVKVQEEFNELIDGNSDKKQFESSLTRIFALLLNTKVETADKIKKILKIVVETTLKTRQVPKQQ